MEFTNKQIYSDEVISQLAFKFASKRELDYSLITSYHIFKDMIEKDKTGRGKEELNGLTISYFAYDTLKEREFKPISLNKLVKQLNIDWDDLMFVDETITEQTIKTQIDFEVYKDLKIVKDRNNKEFLISDSYTPTRYKVEFENDKQSLSEASPKTVVNEVDDVEPFLNIDDFIKWFKNKFMDDHRVLKLSTLAKHFKIQPSTLKQELLKSKCLHTKNKRNYLTDEEIKNVYNKYFKYVN